MPTDIEITTAAESIRNGELVAFPTETVYGLGANALDEIAVTKIFELKGRPRLDPLIVHVADPKQLELLVESLPELAADLIRKFWPGPLSLVLKKLASVPDIVSAGLPSVAVRCPDHEVARNLIAAAKVPIAAPSANRFGRVSPTTAKHVVDQFGERCPMVLDAGPCSVGVESTVLSFTESTDDRPVLLRPGGVPLEEIEKVTGALACHLHEEARPTSPGQLSSHYSPMTPIVLAEKKSVAELARGQSSVGLLSFKEPSETACDLAAIEVLSASGCLREAAANLFAAMRRLDELGLDLIIAEPVPEIDLGRAIMDRLRRAAVPH